jgi:hypothetical protein
MATKTSKVRQEVITIECNKDLSGIENIFTIKDSVVLDYLCNNPTLIPLIYDAYAQLKKYFFESILTLELITDPEEDGWKELFINIITDLSSEDAHKILDKFDEEWWLDKSKAAVGKLCITLN